MLRSMLGAAARGVRPTRMISSGRPIPHRVNFLCTGQRTSMSEQLRASLHPYGDAIVTFGSLSLVTAYAMEDVLLSLIHI